LKLARFDLAIVVNSGLAQSIACQIGRHPGADGADKKKASLFLTTPAAYCNDPGKHTVQENLDLMKALDYQKNEVNWKFS